MLFLAEIKKSTIISGTGGISAVGVVSHELLQAAKASADSYHQKT